MEKTPIPPRPLERCENCRHAHAHTQRGTGAMIRLDVVELQCWRYPPGVAGGPTPQGMAVGSFRPIVTADDTCGEFAPKHAAGN